LAPARQPLTTRDRAPRVGWCAGSGTRGDATFLKNCYNILQNVEKKVDGINIS
jgi:hypothetical protein